MFTMLLYAAFFAVTPDDKPGASSAAAPAISLDGNWTVLCAERDGKALADAKNMTVTAKGDTITCSGKDGKTAVTLKLEFGPNGTLKVSETAGGNPSDKPIAKVGVYVLTQDFFSLCVHDANSTDNANNANNAGNNKPTNTCTFVLQRSSPRPNER